MEADGFPGVADLLSQGPSFRFVDAIVDVAEERVVTQRLIGRADPIFADHFPGRPVYPGVLLIEMMAQTASLIARLEQFKASRQLLREPGTIAKVKALSFFRPAKPGDMLLVHAERGRRYGRLAEFKCLITRDAIRIASGTLVLASPGHPS